MLSQSVSVISVVKHKRCTYVEECGEEMNLGSCSYFPSNSDFLKRI